MIELERVSKVFGAVGSTVRAVDDLSLRVSDGETLCLIGTSGSGKTTAMKMVNRLVEPTSGRILVDGQDVLGMDVIRLRRRLGYVIQKGGLFPHQTVEENVGLLPRLEGWPADRVRARVGELLDLVNLPADRFGKRYPSELSGGQQQRVGVARALALDPPHILMDEPFGALDPITRDGLQEEFLRLKREVRKTIILVTHDLGEAFRLGDRVALMHEGRLLQVGEADDFRHRPATPFVEEFVRSHVGLPAEVRVGDLLDPQVQVVGRALLVAGEERRVDDLPSLPAAATLRDAVDLLMRSPLPLVAVLDGTGAVLGGVTRDSVLKGLS